MGTNQIGKRFYQVKIKDLDVTSLKELGRLMGPLQMQAFRKAYEKILDLTIAEVFTDAVVSLTQYYDQPLRYFTFGDFQIVSTVEEFEEILGCPLGGRKPYLFSGFLPSLSKIAVVVRDSARELDRVKQTRNGVVGLPRKYLEGKARDMANQEEWVPFADVLALLIFWVVLFPNIDGLMDLAAIDAFLAYRHSKESPVVAILADLFDTFDRRCEKNSARIICCLPALCVWLVSHLFQQDIRHPCPLQSHRSSVRKRREGVLFSCGDYPNIPLIGTRGCINYNLALAIRQLGYPMRGAPTEESLSPFLERDFGVQSFKIVQRVHKACESPLRKDKELRGICNGIIGGYHEWLKVHTRGLDWLTKLKIINEENFEALEEDEETCQRKFKLVATDIQKECAELREENAATARALEQETKRTRKEEHGRDKFRGALWGSNKELKLRREERDQSRVHSMVLKEELAACSRSKRSLAQHLEATKQSMLAIIGQYKEELNQSLAHEQKLVEDFAQAYTEKEARGRVIDALHQEVTMWMDRFALTLNGSQDLPRLLAKARAMVEVYFALEEIHGLINYWPATTEKVPAQHAAPATPRPANNATPSTSYNNPRRPPRDQFSPIPMVYSEIWSSLLENHLVVAIPGKVFQPPYPKWYNSNATCTYHSGAPGHNIDSCLPFKYKVQHLINSGWLSFQEEGPNVKINPQASHGGASVNAIEKDRSSGSKRLEDVATSRRFIYQSLQAACMVSHGEGKSGECLFHLGELHDMETCLVGKLEVSERGREELQICTQSAERRAPPTPKALVICFTRNMTSPKSKYPPAVPKPTPFSYQSDKAIPWKYTPPAFRKRAATEVDSLSAKVTNITGLSGITRSGRMFAPPHPTELPSKGKTPMTQESVGAATPSKEVDSPVVRGVEKKEDLQGRAVTLEEAHEFLCLIQQSEFKVVEQLNKTPAKISLLELLISSEPHRALLIRVLNEAHVEHDISVEGFEGIVNHITTNNYLAFGEEEIPVEGRGHNKALHVSVRCMDHVVAKVLIDNGSSLNAVPKTTLEKLPFNASHLKPSLMVVRAFNGSRREVMGEIDIPIQIGPHTCNVVFQVMDINPTYSCLLGRPLIHALGVVPSTLHQKLKFAVGGLLVIVSGEEDMLVSCPSSTPYVEAAEESLETTFQSFEVVSCASVETSPLLPCFSNAALMVARVMLRHGYEPGMRLGKESHRNADVVDIRGNPHKYGLGYEPGKPGRRNAPSRLQADRAWPGHVSQCFISARIIFEEEVAAIGGEAPQDLPRFVRPCHPNFQLGNWNVTSQSKVYTADSM
ncbi:hypothetical protein HKD37_16G045577 [Glycine soja]